ncbi:DNA replication complex GINS family protein [Methanobacterium petrolearium]|uniref:DNA replication complex GINS family protein n=1 Tax=Methanobacterium petrolearium TaxID=710190 RepID=UPI001AE7E9FE|nr:DNA replication complex GINS family protein [Methanobacterium petrolearium]MBP1944700.1 DNA replication factor GINS [Methanobacterium petrolearium]BDZ69964.1 hypothetical protein GCM10025861_04810 [Methanobacterium petrolearium]
MDEFFQNLREIQKKERSLSSLSPVGDDFYQQISRYFNKLMEKIDNNPFSFESYLLRDAQRIVAEICERREHKITNSAVMNVQRSYQLFKDSQEDRIAKIPSNVTPEEEELYRALYQSLATYRQEMRSPLRSYTNKGDPKLKTSSTSSTTDSKIFKKDFKGFVKDEDSSLNRSSGSIDSKKTIIPPSVDEIPPEIQNEIYKQFGKEPSRQSSDESSFSPKKAENVDVRTSSEISDEFKGKTVEKVGNNTSSISKDSSNIRKSSTEILMILDKLPSIMGVDNKVYGPFYPGDIITMPEPNANIIIKNHKGKSIQRYK